MGDPEGTELQTQNYLFSVLVAGSRLRVSAPREPLAMHRDQ